MNSYKFKLLVEEFPFLDEVLRKREEGIFHEGYENLVSQAYSHYGEKPGFRMDKDEVYFVPSYLDVPDDIKIKRGDKNLLARTPSFDSYSYCNGGHYSHESYFAIVSDGDNFQCHGLKEEGSSRTGSGDHNEESAFPISDQLYNLGINPDYIVCYDFQDTDDNGNGEEELNITIYKMKNFNLAEHHCEQIDKAARELKAEIRTVCGGGAK